ncbi:MAG: phosphotransferase [Anaerolineaceae bacterium]|nr:phosphotransferase [Anaerolineaceae bacterium]
MLEPEEIIAQINDWHNARNITLQVQAGGKTNRNFLVTVDGEKFVLRIGGENAAAIGICRATECAAISAAASVGIAPEVVAFFLPEGHLVTRFIEGVEWSVEDFKQPNVIKRVAETLRLVHELPPIEGVFDPYQDIEQRIATAKERGIDLPDRLEEFLVRMNVIRVQRQKSLGGRLGLCHNDPWHNNFIDDGTVRLLDWEFAGMGDPFFDLASSAAVYSAEQKRTFLYTYFGEERTGALEELEQMIFVVMLWNATWALMQVGVGHTDIDYAGMAQHIFGRL